MASNLLVMASNLRERERERRREHLQSLYDIQLLPTEGLVSFWARHQMDTINK